MAPPCKSGWFNAQNGLPPSGRHGCTHGAHGLNTQSNGTSRLPSPSPSLAATCTLGLGGPHNGVGREAWPAIALWASHNPSFTPPPRLHFSLHGVFVTPWCFLGGRQCQALCIGDAPRTPGSVVHILRAVGHRKSWGLTLCPWPSLPSSSFFFFLVRTVKSWAIKAHMCMGGWA